LFLLRNKLNFRLLFITDRKLSKENLSIKVNKACKAGVKAVQLREKDLTANELLETARKIKKITLQYNSSLIINDRLDIALLSHATGLHSPGNGISYSQIQKFNSKLVAGKSVHSVREAKSAQKEGFDYILFGPVFKTPAKVKYGKPQGLLQLKKICSSVKIPVFAVGGINPARVKKCISAGAHGVAVISAIMKSYNIIETVNEFKNELGGL